MKHLLPYILLVIVFAFLLKVSLPNETKPIIPTPTLIIIPTQTPPLNAEKLTTLINDWRVSQGYQPYIQNEDLCTIAKERIKDGKDIHIGLYKKYSNYPSVIQENSVWLVNTEKGALNGWLHSSAHLATLKKPYTYSCIATDQYNALQIFSNLENGTR